MYTYQGDLHEHWIYRMALIFMERHYAPNNRSNLGYREWRKAHSAAMVAVVVLAK